MFIRKTRKIDPKNKKPYFVYQLVESVRTARGPRQRILLSLGSELGIADTDLKLLANRIEEIFTGSPSLLSYSEEIEKAAQHYSSQLVHRLSNIVSSEVKKSEYQSIDIHTIEQQEPRTVGAEHLLLHFCSQLHLQQKLRDLGFSQKEIALSLGTIIARAVFPKSERATYEWLKVSSGLGELINFDFNKTTLDHLYKISDLLLQHKEELEKHLESAQQTVHGYKSTMILYDLTNTYMEGQAKSNPKAKHGVSKEKRTDCPLVTLGLVINEHGFVTRSSFLAGNVSEAGTLQEAIAKLHHFDDLFKPTIILDAGIASEDNLKWLREHKYHYVVSARQNAPSMELESPLVSVGASDKPEVKAALIKSDNIEEKWLYCESEAKRIVASQIKEVFQKRFERELTKMQEGLLKPKGRKKYPKILERIGRLREKYSRVSGCYEIFVEPSSDGLTATSINWKVREEKLEEKLNGYYFLRTNLVQLAPQALWSLYDSIRTIEDSFRFMKSSLGMRPVHHQKEHRVDGHLWITILAYHLIQSCLYQLCQQGLSYLWETVRNWMLGRVRVTMRAETEEGKIIYHRSTTKAEEIQRKIYQALGLTTQILQSRQMQA
jgi:transposase